MSTNQSLKYSVCLALLAVLMFLSACSDRPENPQESGKLPAIYPDYVGVTIPVEIAPLNFNCTDHEVDCMDVVVKGSKGGQMEAHGDYADFDIDRWHELVQQNRGGRLVFSVCTRKDGQWTRHKDFHVDVSPYELGEWGVTYRRIAPGYEVYSHMGLFQRNLSNFDELTILDNTQAPGACLNCHTSHRTNPDRFVFHVRGPHGATMVQMDGKREWLKASNEQLGGSMVYPYWHPTGKYCAFSTNQTRQGFHVVHNERIEVFDLSSDIFVYDPQTHHLITDSLVMTKDWSENSPVFSPDGKWLYFLTCKQQDYPAHYKDEKYNLCRISFDASTASFGHQVDTIYNAVKQGKSLTWPRPSYDGRYLLFTLSDYGYFSIWHDESDQWLLDLQTMKANPLTAANSTRADSYHNWSLNSKWIVFTSRRDDGLYSRLYLCAIDSQGRATKPFLLPQRNPLEYYSETFYSFNTPDFTLKPVEFDARQAGYEIQSDKRVETK